MLVCFALYLIIHATRVARICMNYTCFTLCSIQGVQLRPPRGEMHALRRLTPVLEHALVHLDATLFIFGLIFKISAIIYTYTIEKTKKTMHTEFIIISIIKR